MNSFNVTDIIKDTDLIRKIIIDYGIHGVSMIGTILNLLTIILLNSHKFKHKFYNFLWCRCVCNLLVCVVGIFTQSSPCEFCLYDYLDLYFLMYGVLFSTRIALFASAISDNLLILNRLYNLYPDMNEAFDSLPKLVKVIHFNISEFLYFTKLSELFFKGQLTHLLCAIDYHHITCLFRDRNSEGIRGTR